MPSGAGLFYYVLAAVGIFTLLVGARSARAARPIRRRCTSSGCRSRSSACSRSRSAAGSIASTGSSTGATSSRCWCCRRSSCISRWCSPSVRTCPGYSALLARWLPAIYLPGAVLGLDARARAAARRASIPNTSSALVALLDRLELLYLAAFFTAGLAVLLRALSARALGHGQAPAAVDCLGHGARRDAVRARLRHSVRARRRAVDPMELSAVPLGFIPLAFASAIIRYRLMDVEIILKRLLDLHLGGRGDRRD